MFDTLEVYLLKKIAKRQKRIEAKLDAILEGDAEQIVALGEKLRAGRKALAQAVKDNTPPAAQS